MSIDTIAASIVLIAASATLVWQVQNLGPPRYGMPENWAAFLDRIGAPLEGHKREFRIEMEQSGVALCCKPIPEGRVRIEARDAQEECHIEIPVQGAEMVLRDALTYDGPAPASSVLFERLGDQELLWNGEAMANAMAK